MKANSSGPFRRWIPAAAVMLLAVGGVAVWSLNQPGDNKENSPSTSDGPSPAPVIQKGWVDIRIWRPREGGAIKRRLSEPGATPLYQGDQFRIEAKVTIPEFLYLFWVDTDGDAYPVYPWKTGEWGTRPAREQPIRELSLPPNSGEGFDINDDKKGMETLLLLACESPLQVDDAELQKRLANLPKQDTIQNANAAVWFRNWKVIEDDDDRRSKFFSTNRINDPVLQLQSKLQDRMGDLAPFSSAVSFARLGMTK
jgi:hypothetical protein